MTNQDRDILSGLGVGIILGIVILQLLYCFAISLDNQSSSIEDVTEARFILNDGQSVKALDHEIIIDQENGREYVYFPELGVAPFIDDDGKVLKVTE